jgi:hypothetical protein
LPLRTTPTSPPEPDPAIDRPRAHLALETTEPTAFGHGFISGLLSAILGIAGFGVVVSLRLPQTFMQDDLGVLYGSPYFAAMLHLVLVASFLLGSVSAVLRANKTLALTGIGFTLAAALLGGSRMAPGVLPEGPQSGLALSSPWCKSSCIRPAMHPRRLRCSFPQIR